MNKHVLFLAIKYYKVHLAHGRYKVQKPVTTTRVVKLEALRGVSDPGAWECTGGILLLGYGMVHGPRPTSIVTTHNEVGLLVQ
jgi:hypothetical protein